MESVHDFTAAAGALPSLPAARAVPARRARAPCPRAVPARALGRGAVQNPRPLIVMHAQAGTSPARRTRAF